MDIKNLELVSFLKDNEDYITGEGMLNRAGNAVTDYEELLKQQDKFPKEWREYYLVFPKLLDDYRNREVACFRWRDESQRWVLLFNLVDSYFNRDARFVGPRESLDSLPLGSSESLEVLPLELEINGVKYRKV